MTPRKQTPRLRQTYGIQSGYVVTTPDKWWAGVPADEVCTCDHIASVHVITLHRGKVVRIHCDICTTCRTYNPQPLPDELRPVVEVFQQPNGGNTHG